jgi:hypothetical protein
MPAPINCRAAGGTWRSRRSSSRSLSSGGRSSRWWCPRTTPKSGRCCARSGSPSPSSASARCVALQDEPRRPQHPSLALGALLALPRCCPRKPAADAPPTRPHPSKPAARAPRAPAEGGGQEGRRAAARGPHHRAAGGGGDGEALRTAARMRPPGAACRSQVQGQQLGCCSCRSVGWASSAPGIRAARCSLSGSAASADAPAAAAPAPAPPRSVPRSSSTPRAARS